MSILIVCVGNICRSPMAEAVFHQHLPKHIPVSSAGLAARVGEGVHPLAADVMQAHDCRLATHVARQFDPVMLDGMQWVLTMERRHLRALLAIAPHARGRVHLLGRWNAQREIRDPCGKERPDFEQAFELIQQSARQWCARIA